MNPDDAKKVFEFLLATMILLQLIGWSVLDDNPKLAVRFFKAAGVIIGLCWMLLIYLLVSMP